MIKEYFSRKPMRDKEVVDLPQDSPDGYWELEFKIPTTPNIDTS